MQDQRCDWRVAVRFLDGPALVIPFRAGGALGCRLAADIAIRSVAIAYMLFISKSPGVVAQHRRPNLLPTHFPSDVRQSITVGS
jgi:hypothetical protein